MTPLRSLALALALAAPTLAATAACSVTPAETETSDDELNYRSVSGQEFELSAAVTFKAPESARGLEGEARDAAIATRAAEIRNQIATAMSAELDRVWPKEDRLSREKLAIQYRQGSAGSRDLTPVDGGASYTMTVTGEFSGVKDAEQKLPLVAPEGEPSAKKYLPMTADVGDGPVELRVYLTPVARSRNAYPKYMELFEDGLDIAVHAGGDHHEPPKDIAHARSVYDDLVASGFRSPVASFEELEIDSGPLTKTIRVKGRDVPVRVSIFHVDMTPPDARQPLLDAYRRSMKEADVVIYDGHAGKRLDYSGVVLAYKPSRVSVPATDFKNIETPRKQQVYVFNGCETYTGYADMLYLNPNRTPENTDVITTANYSAIQSKANQVNAFIHAFIDEKSGAWIPRSWDSVLSKMDAVGERSWVHVYGVHGLDDNPKVSPLADVSKVGQRCSTDADCGAADSRCLSVSSSRRVCGVACADSAGCPRGTRCALPRGATGPDAMQCVR